MLKKIDSKIANHGLRYKQDTKTALKIIEHFLRLNKFYSRHTLGQAFTNIIQYLIFSPKIDDRILQTRSYDLLKWDDDQLQFTIFRIINNSYIFEKGRGRSV